MVLLLLVIIIIISLDQENLGKRVARLWLNYMNLSQATAAPSSPPQSSVSKMLWLECKCEVIADNGSMICFSNELFSYSPQPSWNLTSWHLFQSARLSWSEKTGKVRRTPLSARGHGLPQGTGRPSAKGLGSWWVWSPYIKPFAHIGPHPPHNHW